MNGALSCSIVLYCHNHAFLQPLLQGLQRCALVNTIFLIDNSPTDALKTLAEAPKTTYIFNNANLGYGAAHNIALKKAMGGSKYHIVLNPDVTFDDGTIESIYAYMQNHNNVGLLMPKIVYPNGSLQYACKLLPAPADLILRRFLPAALFKKRTEVFEMRASGYNKIMEVPYLSGCFMFLRVDALAKAGVFDERFFMYPEDSDLTRRIHQHYKTIFYPFAQITHVHQRESYKNARLFFIHMVNIARYFNKWGWFVDKGRQQINKKIKAQFTQ